MQRLQAAAEGEGEQHGHFDGQRDRAKARLRDGIVGGFLVRSERDAPVELLGNGVAVGEDVRDLAASQARRQTTMIARARRKARENVLVIPLCENGALLKRETTMTQDATHLVWLTWK